MYVRDFPVPPHKESCHTITAQQEILQCNCAKLLPRFASRSIQNQINTLYIDGPKKAIPDDPLRRPDQP